MVHFKSKDNLSPAQVKAFCEIGWRSIRSATNVKWLGCAAGYTGAGLLTLSIWSLINTSCVWMAYFIPKRVVGFATRRLFLCWLHVAAVPMGQDSIKLKYDLHLHNDITSNKKKKVAVRPLRWSMLFNKSLIGHFVFAWPNQYGCK